MSFLSFCAILTIFFQYVKPQFYYVKLICDYVKFFVCSRWVAMIQLILAKEGQVYYT